MDNQPQVIISNNIPPAFSPPPFPPSFPKIRWLIMIIVLIFFITIVTGGLFLVQSLFSQKETLTKKSQVQTSLSANHTNTPTVIPTLIIPSQILTVTPVLNSNPTQIINSNYQKLFDSLEKNPLKSLSVIVGLNMPFKPEGKLTNQEKQSQQAEIKRLREQLINEINQFHISNIGSYKYIPYFSVTVDKDALLYLFQSNLVSSIEKNIELKAQ